jgi:hypothetical protein
MSASVQRSKSALVLLIALPGLAILLNLLAWIVAVSRSGFWADDFLNVTRYSHSLGDLLNDRANTGKYTLNLFWALGTLAFGAGSAVPFIILNTLVFAAGLVIWLRVGTRARWSVPAAWWIGGLFIATAAWLPTALWSTNITHSCGFFALGAGLWAHERSLRASTTRSTLLWSLLGGLAWTFAIVSNLLYLGLLVIAVYCGFHQVLKLRRLGVETIRATAAVGTWSLLIPILYFVTIAYPATVASSAYTNSGLHFVHGNFDFYKETLAPTDILITAYVGVVILALGCGILGARRRDWFPITLLVAAVATTAPALLQSQQQDIHYVAMPLLLVFSSLMSGMRPVLTDRREQLARLRYPLLLAAAVALALLFNQGSIERSYFVRSPYGSSLMAFRSEVASLTPENSIICASFNLTPQYQEAFIAEMSAYRAFLVPPINAYQAYLTSIGEPCPASGPIVHIVVGLNAHGDFVASG